MNETVRRFLMMFVGVLISGFCVGLFNYSAFGMDPFQVLAHGIFLHTPLGFGTLYMLINLLMLAAIFVIDRRKIGIGTFINIFLLGYVVEFSSWLLDEKLPNPTLLLRIIFLLVGLTVLCLGAALYFVGDMGVSTYDAVSLILGERTPIRFQYWRIGTDLICTGTGFLLGGTVGIGTVATAFFMGPIIAFFRKTIALPLRYGQKEARRIRDSERASAMRKKGE